MQSEHDSGQWRDLLSMWYRLVYSGLREHWRHLYARAGALLGNWCRVGVPTLPMHVESQTFYRAGVIAPAPIAIDYIDLPSEVDHEADNRMCNGRPTQ